jgi:hypothetical protein
MKEYDLAGTSEQLTKADERRQPNQDRTTGQAGVLRFGQGKRKEKMAPRILALVLLLSFFGETAGAFELKEPKQSLVQTEAECHKLGGTWWSPGMPGNPRPKICDLPTKDKGKNCTDSSECEGYCLISKIFGITVTTKGKCSGHINLVGCNKILEAGKVKEVCFD